MKKFINACKLYAYPGKKQGKPCPNKRTKRSFVRAMLTKELLLNTINKHCMKNGEKLVNKRNSYT